MNCDAVDAKCLKCIPFLGLRDLALLVNLDVGLLQLRKHVTTFILGTQVQHLPKDRTCTIKMRRRGKGNEKLAAVYDCASRILRARGRPILDGARGHRENAARIVF